MIAAKHDHVFRMVALHDIDVLVQRVCSALVPLLFFSTLLRGQDLHKFPDLRAHESPGALQMANQRMRFVLGQHADAANAGIHAIG